MVLHSKYVTAIVGAGLVLSLAGALSGCSGSSTTSNAASTSSSSPSSTSLPSSSPSSSSVGGSDGNASLAVQCKQINDEMTQAASGLTSLTGALSSGDEASLEKAQTEMDNFTNTFTTAAAKVTDAQLKPVVTKLGQDLTQLDSIMKALVTASKSGDTTALSDQVSKLTALSSSYQADGEQFQKICGM